MMKCFSCKKTIFSLQKYCPNCGTYISYTIDDKKLLDARRKKLNNSFVYSKKNIKAIKKLNDGFYKKIEQIYKNTCELRQLFFKLQEQGMEEFYEFNVEAYLVLNEFKPTPIVNQETAKKITKLVFFTDTVPQFHFMMDYNGIYETQDNLLKEIKHTGVFKNSAFDKLKLCRMMDIVFNQQKIISLEDALYLNANDWSIEFFISTSKHLWERDETLFDKYSFAFRCAKCGKFQFPLYRYCPNCGKNKTEMAIKKEIYKKHWKKYRRNEFDWNYKNKTAVFALNDKISEIFYSSYDEMFKIQKIFKKEFSAGKKYFNTFYIETRIKYNNKNPFPNVNKKMALFLNNSFNTNTVYKGIDTIFQDTEFSEKEKNDNVLLGGLNWNIECFDRCFVGNHSINYFMHSVFQDGDDYLLSDIPYMNIEDFYPQYEIHLSEDCE